MLPSREATEEEIRATGLVHRVYIPQEHKPQEPRPMVVLVHGRAGNASVMWYFGKAFCSGKARPIIISPQAPFADPIGGFSWWETKSGIDSRSLDEKFEDAVSKAELLKRFIESATELYGADSSQLVAAGFSQGSGVASTLGLIEPFLFRGIGILAGFIPQAVMQKLSGSTMTSKTRYLVVHGTLDEVIPASRAQETVSWLQHHEIEVESHFDEVKHKVGSQGLKKLESWYLTF